MKSYTNKITLKTPKVTSKAFKKISQNQSWQFLGGFPSLQDRNVGYKKKPFCVPCICDCSCSIVCLPQRRLIVQCWSLYILLFYFYLLISLHIIFIAFFLLLRLSASFHSASSSSYCQAVFIYTFFLLSARFLNINMWTSKRNKKKTMERFWMKFLCCRCSFCCTIFFSYIFIVKSIII